MIKSVSVKLQVATVLIFIWFSVSSANANPNITEPIAGAQFSGSSVVFTWMANGTAVEEWWLSGASLPGVDDVDLFSSGSLGSDLAYTAEGLPTDGRPVYIQLWYRVNSIWDVIEIQYTAADPPELLSPSPGTTLSGSSVAFTWTANGIGVEEWWLSGASLPGGNDVDLFSSGSLGDDLSYTAEGLPTDGRPVYIQLWYRVNSIWDVIEIQYTAADIPINTDPPELLSPSPGTTLPGSTVTFTWTANGTAVEEWWLSGASLPGGNDVDLFSSGSLGDDLSYTAEGLPTDGRPVYIQLWYRVNSIWDVIEIQYTAADIPINTDLPELLSPSPGTTLPGSTVTFTWTANGTAVEEWWLSGASLPGVDDVDLFSSGSLGSDLSYTAEGLPTDGRTVYIQLWYRVSSIWDLVEVEFVAAAGSIAIISPHNLELSSSQNITVEVAATGFQPSWGVEFVIDGDDINSVKDHSIPFDLILTDLSKKEYSITVYMVDQNDTRQTAYTDSIVFGIGDYYVAFGDSITDGVGDDIAIDDISADGRNVGGGYMPILNDLLTAAKGIPHTVVNETIPGYESGDGVAVINDAIAAHPNSKYFLILFGTNDSDISSPVMSGLNALPGDEDYPGTFKDNMQQIIDAVQDAAKIPLISKVPIRYGDCSEPGDCDAYPDPANAPANILIQDYNLVIDQLITENNLEFNPENYPGVMLSPPDLYSYYESTGVDGSGKSPQFFDWLHPNGFGYQSLADLWLQALVPVP